MTSAWKLVVHLENYLHLTDIHCCSLGVLNYSSLPHTTHIHQHMHALTHMHTRRGRANGRNGKITFAGSKKSTIPY